jgi:transposase
MTTYGPTTAPPDEIQEDLRKWREAERRVSNGQEYEIGGRRLRRADLKEIRTTIYELRRELQQAHGGSVLGTNVGLPSRSYRG